MKIKNSSLYPWELLYYPEYDNFYGGFEEKDEDPELRIAKKLLEIYCCCCGKRLLDENFLFCVDSEKEKFIAICKKCRKQKRKYSLEALLEEFGEFIPRKLIAF